jgi:hypothetical protein
MDGYYAYIIGPDGHVINRVDLRFDNDEDAIDRAKIMRPNSSISRSALPI